MENTNDKSFERNNSDKPFIRTMEDDLKKIKNTPPGKEGVASAISSYAAASSQQNMTYKEIKQPAPFQPLAQVPVSSQPPAPDPIRSSAPDPIRSSIPASVSTPKPIPAPIFSVPKNLPVNNTSISKEEFAEGMKPKIAKAPEKTKDIVDSNVPDSRVFAGLSLSKEEIFGRKKPLSAAPSLGGEEKATPVSKPIVPVSKPITPFASSSFPRKTQGLNKLDEETEKLSPEARLARQSSLDISDERMESRERFTASPVARTSPVFSERPKESVAPLSPSYLDSLPSENNRRSMEEIIKEDHSNSFFRKFIKVMLVFLLIVGVAGGVFYLYISRNPVANPPVTSNPTVTLINGATEVVLNADLNTDFNGQILKYFSAARPSGIYNMILKDKDGKNYLPLENFVNILDIVFPDYVANAIEKDYNLIAFNYPEKNYLRLGLVLKSKNSVDITAVAKKWEGDMYRNVKPIFFDDFGVYEEGKKFGSNKYKNFDIRYLPLGFENIGLNYAIDDGKKFLLIATSKQDIFSLIDKIIIGK